MTPAAQILASGSFSLVIVDREGNLHTFSRKGVADLFHLLSTEPRLLRGASLADKVVGKGAAALMALGRVSEVYAAVISSPALNLLRNAGIAVSFAAEVPSIRNRAASGPCPVESLCAPCSTPEECLPLIENFINSIK